MGSPRKFLLILSLLALNGQSLALVTPQKCNDHDPANPPANMPSITMDHEDHHQLSEQSIAAQVEASECCELDCSQCPINHSPSPLLPGPTPFRPVDFTQPRQSLISEALLYKNKDSLFKPPKTR